MLCQACNNVLSRKSARWKGSYKATFESGDGGRQLTSTDSTTSEPEANSTDHPGLDDLGPEADSSDDADLDGLDPEANLSDNAGLEDSGPEADSSDDEGLNDEADESFDPLKPGGFVHHPSGRAFLAAAHEGCQLCLFLLFQLSPEQRIAIAQEPEDIDTGSADYDYVLGYSLQDDPEGRVEWRYNGCYRPRTLNDTVKDRPIELQFKFFPSMDQEPLSAPDTSYPTVVGQGESSVSLVRQWIAACDKHDDCRRRSLSNVYKAAQGRLRFSRIIDVQDGSADPRLADVDQVPADALYMTLSHCWGDPRHKPLTLTLDTLAALKKRIPWNRLPKTFADAIVFTRNMGVRYIWIDSLCIIQDCVDDWASQSAVMCEIYTGSYLNIAATGAVDSRGGLFSPRDNRALLPLRVVQPSPPGGPSWGNDSVQYYDVLDDHIWEREVEGALLCRRGWIVQERVLPMRCVHFGTRQLYWECASMQASESSLPVNSYEYPGFKSYDPLLLSSTSGPEIIHTWTRLVQTYTRGGLTKETDKLVAISGLAKALAAQSGMEYLAGLWNHQLVQQLLWRAESPSKRPAVFRAPSWSWASTNSKISWTFDESRAIKILRIGGNPVPPTESFTTFTSIPLTIRGALIPGSLSVVSGSHRLVTTRINSISPEWSLCDFSPDSDSEQDNTGPVLLLSIDITMMEFEELNGLLFFTVSGIVLKATGSKGTFRRVGHFQWNKVLPGQVPIRDLWLLDCYKPPDSDDEIEEILSSKIDPIEGVGEDLYHDYEKIGDSGDQARGCFEEDYDWTRVFSGGFTFDLV